MSQSTAADVAEVTDGQEGAESKALSRQAIQAVREETTESDLTGEVRVHDDHTREVKTPGFSRMPMEWSGAEAVQMTSLRSVVDDAIAQTFPDALYLMHELWDIVREADVNEETGEVATDRHGLTIWKRSPTGAYIEDYSRLGIRERENFLLRITTNLYDWKQRQADLWGEAMFAKALWEERFSDGFVSDVGKVGRLTVDDRTNRARQHAIEQRYFAIFQSLTSRRADAVVNSLELLGQRLKDLLTS